VSSAKNILTERRKLHDEEVYIHAQASDEPNAWWQPAIIDSLDILG